MITEAEILSLCAEVPNLRAENARLTVELRNARAELSTMQAVYGNAQMELLALRGGASPSALSLLNRGLVAVLGAQTARVMHDDMREQIKRELSGVGT